MENYLFIEGDEMIDPKVDSCDWRVGRMENQHYRFIMLDMNVRNHRFDGHQREKEDDESTRVPIMSNANVVNQESWTFMTGWKNQILILKP